MKEECVNTGGPKRYISFISAVIS